EGTKGWFVVSVSDHGRGIPDEIKEDIFGRFSTAPKKKGSSGLGLHIVQTLLRRYGGKVRVEDRVKGSTEDGSVFHVRLPED
ncbi:MAG: HAMP domain-containing histidine kinase, partial [Thermoplasmata archaeon]|nr:HAMP domain-containing histidine kinase [Thermoplasmata archaeon]